LRTAGALAREGPAQALDALLGIPPAGRDVWIARRAPSDPLESALVLWSARRGAAILREPGDRHHPALVAWVRPSLLADDPAALVELAAGVRRLAPRMGGGWWLRRRLGRLRALIVDGPEVAPVLAAVADWSLTRAPRVLPFPQAGW